MNQEKSPFIKELESDMLAAHRLNNPPPSREVTAYLGGSSSLKKYIKMKSGDGTKRLVHYDENKHKYVLVKGAKVFLSSIRGQYVYV
jgi:hypothetical protein